MFCAVERFLADEKSDIDLRFLYGIRQSGIAFDAQLDLHAGIERGKLREYTGENGGKVLREPMRMRPQERLRAACRGARR